MVSLEDVTAFLVTVKNHSLTAAAAELRVSISTVTKRISRLEESLRAKLIIRTSRSINLTKAGELFYNSCQNIPSIVDDATNELQALYSKPGGELRVYSSSGTGTRLVAPLIADFTIQYPDFNVQLMTYGRANLQQLGQFSDVFVGNLDPGTKNLQCRSLGFLPYIVCGSAGYFEKRGRPRKPEDLGDHRCIIYFDTKRGRLIDEWPFADGDRQYTVKVSGSVVVNNSASIFELLTRDVGICLIPKFAVHKEIASGAIEELFVDRVAFRRELNAYFPRTHHLSANLRFFLEFVETKLREVNTRDLQPDVMARLAR